MTVFPDADLPLHFEVRFVTKWVDLSSRFIKGQPVSRTTGRPSGAGRLSSASFGVTLGNDDGALTPLNPRSIYYPHVGLDVAGRARLRWFEDLFTRSQTDTWGADWTNSGGAGSDYDVTGTAATQTLTSVNVLRTSLAVPAVATGDNAAVVSVPATATGGPMTTWVATGSSATTFYAARPVWLTDGTMRLDLLRWNASVETSLGQLNMGAYTPGQHWGARVQAACGVVRAKAWVGDLEDETDDWQITVLDTAPLADFSKAGLFSRRETGNTNANPVVSWHEVQVNADRAYGYTDSWQIDLTTDTSGIYHSIVRTSLSGPTRRLFQGGLALRSPLYRTMAGVAPGDYVPYLYWPMEDGSNATQLASGLPGGTPIGSPFAGAITPAGIDGPAGSEPLAQLAAGAKLPFTIPAYSSTQIAFQWQLLVPSEPAAEMTLAEFYAHSGPVRRWKISIVPGAPSAVWIRDYDAAGTEINAGGVILDGSGIGNPSEAAVFGHWVTMLFAPQQTGGNVSSWLGIAAAPPGGAPGYANVDAGTLGAITSGFLYGGEAGCGIGHLAAYIDTGFDLGFTGEAPKANVRGADGYNRESPEARAARLGHELNIPVLVVGSSGVSMGPQPVASLEDILGECEDAAAAGVLGEHELGFSFVARRYDQPVTLTVDLRTYRLQQGDEDSVLTGTYDDQNTVTVSEVDRPDGSFAIVAATTPRTTLPYVDPITANLADDGQTVQLAAFRANRGSVDHMRFTSTPVDLMANPGFIAAWQQATTYPGLGRIVRTGLPAAHAPYDLDDLVDGWTDTYQPRKWGATYNAQPAEPYDVAKYDDGKARYGAAGTTTAEALDATETGVDIAVPAGHPGWVTTASHPACYSPGMAIEVEGELMTATACVSTGAGTYTLTVVRNVNGIPGGKTHLTGAPVFIVNTGRYAY